MNTLLEFSKNYKVDLFNRYTENVIELSDWLSCDLLTSDELSWVLSKYELTGVISSKQLYKILTTYTSSDDDLPSVLSEYGLSNLLSITDFKKMLSTCGPSDLKFACKLKVLLPSISYFSNEEDLMLLRKCGLSNLTFKNFIDSKLICVKLLKLFDNCHYNISYEIVFSCYENYLSDYFMSILNLESNLDYDFEKTTKKMTRQIRNDSFRNGMSDEAKSDLSKGENEFKQNFPVLGYSYKDNELAPNIKRFFKFPHKVWMPILYNLLLEVNKDADISDFKVFFYDLMEVIIRDKSILKNDEDSVSNYSTLRRFKIKRVERLILS